MRRARLAVALAAVGLLVAPIMAGSPMNLGELSQGAEKIFRGTVVEVSKGSVDSDGVAVATLKYVLRVDEAFKGSFDTVKDVQTLEIETPYPSTTTLRAQTPLLNKGTSYVLFTSPGADGAVTMTGGGQGCFQVVRDEHTNAEVVANEIKNNGLFVGMPWVDAQTDGLVSYSELVREIRAELGQQ